MANVFISYGWDDGREFAEYLGGILENVGIHTFIAPRDIDLGDTFGDKIDKEIDTCSNFVVILTEKACQSHYVKYEIQRAIISKKRIIPCKYSTLDRDKVPDSIKDRQYFEFESKEALARRVIVEVSPETPSRNMPAIMDIRQVGIKRIFPNRRLYETNQKLSEELDQALRKHIPKSRIVRMMGISFRDFFGSDTEDWKVRYADIVRKALDNGVRFQVILLDPTSEAAKDRAITEEGERVKDDNEYKNSVLFRDIKRVTEWFCEKRKDRRMQNLLRVRYSNLMPTVFLILTDEIVFVEQYHIGDLSRLEQSKVTKEDEKAICLGGYVPFFLVDARSDFARLMESHFENIWNKMQDNTLERIYEKINEFEMDPVTFRMRQFIDFINKYSNTLRNR